MSKGLWDQPGVPHKGWTPQDMIDHGEATERCEMCGQESVRFTHIVVHGNYPHPLAVGCVCAEKMAAPYDAKHRETLLRNKAQRRANWLTRAWRVSAKGNRFLNVDGLNVGVSERNSRWSWWLFVDGTDQKLFSGKQFATRQEAQLDLFEEVWAHSNGE